MKHTVAMASGAMIYKPSFIKTGSGIQTFVWGGGGIHGHTYSMVVSYANFNFFSKQGK
jgi:hypothetical protein